MPLIDRAVARRAGAMGRHCAGTPHSHPGQHTFRDAAKMSLLQNLDSSWLRDTIRGLRQMLRKAAALVCVCFVAACAEATVGPAPDEGAAERLLLGRGAHPASPRPGRANAGRDRQRLSPRRPGTLATMGPCDPTCSCASRRTRSAPMRRSGLIGIEDPWFLFFAHDRFRKPVPIHDQVGDGSFRGHAWVNLRGRSNCSRG